MSKNCQKLDIFSKKLTLAIFWQSNGNFPEDQIYTHKWGTIVERITEPQVTHNRSCVLFGLSRAVRFGPKFNRSALNGTNIRLLTYKIRFHNILALISKSSRFVQFGANLTYFATKCGSPVVRHTCGLVTVEINHCWPSVLGVAHFPVPQCHRQLAIYVPESETTSWS